MRPLLTAVIAAIEAGAVALAGVVVVALPALLLWLVQFGPSADPAVVLGGTVSTWLLAHLIPLEFGVDAEVALGMGLPPEALAIPISLAPLGLTLLTVLLAGRAGLRFARDGGTGIAGVLGGMIGFAGVTAVLGGFAIGADSVPFWVLVLVPSSVYGASALVAFLVRAVRTQHPWWQRSMRAVGQAIERAGLSGAAALPERGLEVLRLVLAGLCGLAVLASLGVVVALIGGYAEVTALAQGLQLDPGGAVVMFLLQLAYLPVILIWAGAWFSGAGFSIGEGTLISPFETLAGPLPAVPILGALPEGWGAAALLAPMLIVVLGLGIGVLSSRLTGLRGAPWAAVIVVPLLSAVLVGLVVAGAVGLASGSIGPERFAVVGAEPWVVAGLVAAEFGGGLLLGAVAGRIDGARIRAAVPAMAERVGEGVSSGLAASSSGVEAFTRKVRGSRGERRRSALAADETEAEGIEALELPGPARAETGAPDAAESAETEDLSGISEFAGTADLADPDPDPDRAETREVPDRGEPASGGGEDPETAAAEAHDADAAAADPDDAADHADADEPDDLPPLAEGDDPELTPEEEEALLRAFSWDGEAPSKQE